VPRFPKKQTRETPGSRQMQTVPRFMQIAPSCETMTLWALDVHGRVWELRGDGWHRETSQVAPFGWQDPGPRR